jgi:hypothetical protein
MRDVVNAALVVLTVVALVAAGWFLFGWLIMLGIGILFNAGVIEASLGWQDSFWLGAITSVILGFTATAARSK